MRTVLAVCTVFTVIAALDGSRSAAWADPPRRTVRYVVPCDCERCERFDYGFGDGRTFGRGYGWGTGSGFGTGFGMWAGFGFNGGPAGGYSAGYRHRWQHCSEYHWIR
jgi:hypothetical protein